MTYRFSPANAAVPIKLLITLRGTVDFVESFVSVVWLVRCMISQRYLSGATDIWPFDSPQTCQCLFSVFMAPVLQDYTDFAT